MKQTIQRAFNSAHNYRTHATTQQQSARDLLAFAQQHLECTKQQRILEVGCGGGALTELLYTTCPNAQIAALDIAPSLLDAARNHCPASPRFDWQLGDIEHYQYPHTFDCIYANFSLQWLSDPRKVYQDMLVHSAALCFSVPLASSFIALRHLCHEQGVQLSLRALPTAEQLTQYTQNHTMRIHMQPYWMMFEHPLAALTYFKNIGAHANEHAPSHLFSLRRVKHPISINFDVAHCVVTHQTTQ